MHVRLLTPAHMTDAQPWTQQLGRAVSAVRTMQQAQPAVALVLGSGLGGLADTLEDKTVIPYSQIEGMPRSTVPGHSGALVLGRRGALRVAAMQGRVHLYEGHAPERVVLGVRLMIALGARVVILTNAAGGIHDDLDPGELMLIRDQLNLTGHNPLVGSNDDAVGPRFPSMNDAYDPALRELTQRVAHAHGGTLHSGVYAGLLGPSYETPAEIRMLRTLGADAVGMSTVLETIAARHMGARCLGISCITNRAAGLAANAPTHDEVQATAEAARTRFVALMAGVLDALAAEQRA
jgi:purine-nucleoside phosphorylase